MTAIRRKNKKTREEKILAAPLITAGFFLGWIFLLGWILYFIGDKKGKKPQQTTKKHIPQDTVQLMMIPQEEQIIQSI